MPECQLLTSVLFSELIERARQSPRRRVNHNFHSGPADNPHRFLNVILEGSYVAPHRHLNPPKAESFIVLEGSMAAYIFDNAGQVEQVHVLGQGPNPRGIDVPAGLWHSVIALTPHAVCYEVKPGPWDPASDKEFAPWAPREDDPRASAYLTSLLEMVGPGSTSMD
jgi:cupin fold WbuC family metalloprotein